ncbi:hypothetical protein NOR51B_32 [Luminiphilus syltensis NOR5-1B]|uniref:Uncharacterized protein n=1 Tax=Luminiphilus syltensis NOR5-1B TaxID=565045 RepID=B8KSQ9_9GAMM|nr:hypothetical protein [Luminiphilus syltensis]EED34095.1 hypothetical protein NOR51B_32 [Luminiphilus syltensis NOR5-1B]
MNADIGKAGAGPLRCLGLSTGKLIHCDGRPVAGVFAREACASVVDVEMKSAWSKV